MTTPDDNDPCQASWEIGPFVKVPEPILGPDPDLTFTCPVSGATKKWAIRASYNPTAVVRDGKIYLLYRAEDNPNDVTGPEGWFNRVGRLGLAWSEDGLKFTSHPTPVLYPDNDDCKPYEWSGGCEDLHTVEDEDGTYWGYYTAQQGAQSTDSMMVASSTDLIHWTKHGRALPGVARSRTGQVIARLEDGRMIAEKIDAKYWMYWSIGCFLAASDDLVHWTPIAGNDGTPIPYLQARKGYFDSGSCEIGAIALRRDDGILITYNAYNRSAADGGDPSLPSSWASLGQALFDRDDPTRLLERSEKPFLTAELEWECNGIFSNCIVSNGLVHFKDRWHIYYGAADKWTGTATCDG